MSAENGYPFGKPMRIDRDLLEQRKRIIINSIAEQVKTEVPDLPENIKKARNDAAIAFLEEGILPVLNRNGNIRIPNDVLTGISSHFISRFREERPKDFDLTEPIELIEILSANTLVLDFVYGEKVRRGNRYRKMLSLIQNADTCLNNVLEEHYADLPEE